VNGAGNLAARTATMIEKYCEAKIPAMQPDCFDTAAFWTEYEKNLSAFHFDETIRALERYVTAINQAIDTEAPFKKAKEGIDVSPFMYQIAEALRHVGIALLPIVPEAAEKILAQLSITSVDIHLPKDQEWGRLAPETSVVKGAILFPRLPA
jgi:methionyl-tRNA synthetase